MLNLETARQWYSETDSVHGYDHIVRVYHLAERLAILEGADLEIVRAAALLHDAHPTNLEEKPRRDHQLLAADFALQVLQAEGWESRAIEAVQHCIRAHRVRDDSEQPRTLEARILFDADKLDAIGAIGVARAIGYAVLAGQPIYARPSSLFAESGKLEEGEKHSAYHEFIFKLRKLKGRLYTPSAQAIAVERQRAMVDFFERLAREWMGEI